jgi:hypothetical protein
MNKYKKQIINELINNDSFTSNSLFNHLQNNPEDIHELKKILSIDSQSEQHRLIINYIKKHHIENRKEIFDEICKIYRKPFLIHRTSLSRILIVNQEIFLHIVKNDKRFFKDGPERTSVDVIEKSLNNYLSTFFPNYFTKDKKVRKKEIYDALMILEDETNPSLITTTKLKPGTGTGKRRRKRYCLTDDGLHELIPIILIVIIDELDNLLNQI